MHLIGQALQNYPVESLKASRVFVTHCYALNHIQQYFSPARTWSFTMVQ